MAGDGAFRTAEKWDPNDELENSMRFCGWPEAAVKAVKRGCGNCSACTDMSPSGSHPWEVQGFPCAFWVNLPLSIGVMCCPMCACSTKIRNYQKVDHLTGGNGTCLEHWLATVAAQVFCVGPCYAASMRSDLRKKYDIQGSPCMDFWCGCCFEPCTICQEGNELQKKAQPQYYIPKAPLPGAALHPTKGASPPDVATGPV